MRSTTLETFDGKDIIVPNEMFVGSTFVNWTRKNKKQRYRVDFRWLTTATSASWWN